MQLPFERDVLEEMFSRQVLLRPERRGGSGKLRPLRARVATTGALEMSSHSANAPKVLPAFQNRCLFFLPASSPQP
jgi:hypothetical protein